MIIHLVDLLPDHSCDRPGDWTDRLNRPPIWSCSGWGFPCHLRYRKRGVLLPRRFALTSNRQKILGSGWRSIFCGTFPGVAPAGCYPASCPMEPGLSSALTTAIIQPAPILLKPTPVCVYGIKAHNGSSVARRVPQILSRCHYSPPGKRHVKEIWGPGEIISPGGCRAEPCRVQGGALPGAGRSLAGCRAEPCRVQGGALLKWRAFT